MIEDTKSDKNFSVSELIIILIRIVNKKKTEIQESQLFRRNIQTNKFGEIKRVLSTL